MRVAITLENNQVFQHFGRTPSFMIYDIDDNNNITHQCEMMCNGIGHSALVNILKEAGVDTVICGGLGLPMYNNLISNNIQVFGGVEGNVDEVIKDFVNGTLDYDPNAAIHHRDCHHSMLS